MKEAIEGGYKLSFFEGEMVAKTGDLVHPVMMYKELLDPLFWQSLGKALGWDEIRLGKPEGHAIPWGEEYWQWRYEWHCFIDHIAEGKDVDSFFKELLK